MSRQNHETINVSDILISDKLRCRANVETLADTFTMSVAMPPIQVLDPGGAARVVLLPPETLGLIFLIKNAADAAEVITVEEDSSTTTIATIASLEAAVLFCDGTTWHTVVGGVT